MSYYLFAGPQWRKFRARFPPPRWRRVWGFYAFVSYLSRLSARDITLFCASSWAPSSCNEKRHLDEKTNYTRRRSFFYERLSVVKSRLRIFYAYVGIVYMGKRYRQKTLCQNNIVRRINFADILYTVYLDIYFWLAAAPVCVAVWRAGEVETALFPALWSILCL